MSKHPTSMLSHRDRACIEYGRRLDDLLTYFYPNRRHIDYERLYEAVDSCRLARERIFRDCCNCTHEDDFHCDIRHERLVNSQGFKDYAPICPHYKEKEDSNG